MTGLSGCSNRIEPDYSPSLVPSVVEFPRIPLEYSMVDALGNPEHPEIAAFNKAWQQAAGILIIERKVLYKDLLRHQGVHESINRKWYEVWK